jgi:purine nucleosidase
MSQKQVFLDHDGGVDDLLSLLMLLCMDEVELKGVAVTPADCFGKYAVEASRKFLDLMGASQVEVALSEVRGIHAFPEQWRAQPMAINAFPPLLHIHEPQAPLSSLTAVDFVIEQISSAAGPVSYLLTGPCTTLAEALRREPSIRSHINEIIWMAGALEVHGNVRSYAHDGSAEWNVYWDAVSARWLAEQELPLVLVPLDATNRVPVSREFLNELAEQSDYAVSQLASYCWALTINTIPAYDYTYHMWDVLATAYVARPSLFSTASRKISVSSCLPDEGRTRLESGNGSRVSVVRSVQQEAFYAYVKSLFRRNFSR